MNINNL